MIDHIVTWTLSNPKTDKLVTWIMTMWVLILAARVAGQIIGGP